MTSIAARSRGATLLSRLLLSSVGLFALAGCFGPTGPVIGDWRGIGDTTSTFYYARIELILDGPPGATAGKYHYVRLEQTDPAYPGPRFIEWADRWTVRPYVVGGQALRLVHLHAIPNGYLPDYVWLPNDLLLPVANPAKPDFSRAAFIYALAPVPRGTFGYGRP